MSTKTTFMKAWIPRPGARLLAFFFLLVFTLQCSTSPTGRKQLAYLPNEQMDQMGDAAFTQMKQGGATLASNSPQFQYVQCITRELLKAMDEDAKAWKVEVFNDPSPNAFALPGNNVGVHTGMIELTRNQSQLAAVIGHEIGHVKALHGNERASQQLVVQGGMVGANIFLGQDSNTDRLIMAALGVGAQVGVLLPFSRTHEREADELGIKYMAQAGFDPFEAPELWKIMKEKAQGSPPEFLSSHPSPSSRIEHLQAQAKNLQDTYQRVQTKPNCRN